MEIKVTQLFLKSAKALSKKYRSFNDDYRTLIRDLEENPELGVDLGDGFRKVRMAVGSKGKGKSGGCRVITLDMIRRNDTLYLIFIYDKSQAENVKLNVLKKLIEELEI